MIFYRAPSSRHVPNVPIRPNYSSEGDGGVWMSAGAQVLDPPSEQVCLFKTAFSRHAWNQNYRN